MPKRDLPLQCTVSGLLKKNQNAPRLSEHPPVRGEKMSCSVSAAAIETLNHWLTKVFKSAELASPEQIVLLII